MNRGAKVEGITEAKPKLLNFRKIDI